MEFIKGIIDPENWSGEDETLKQPEPDSDVGAGFALAFFVGIVIVAMYAL